MARKAMAKSGAGAKNKPHNTHEFDIDIVTSVKFDFPAKRVSVSKKRLRFKDGKLIEVSDTFQVTTDITKLMP